MPTNIPFVPADDLSKLWRAIIEFDMLAPGDRILVGLSGGKDSMLLTAMLAEIKKFSPIPFDLACYTVNATHLSDERGETHHARIKEILSCSVSLSLDRVLCHNLTSSINDAEYCVGTSKVHTNDVWFL